MTMTLMGMCGGRAALPITYYPAPPLSIRRHQLTHHTAKNNTVVNSACIALDKNCTGQFVGGVILQEMFSHFKTTKCFDFHRSDNLAIGPFGPGSLKMVSSVLHKSSFYFVLDFKIKLFVVQIIPQNICDFDRLEVGCFQSILMFCRSLSLGPRWINPDQITFASVRTVSPPAHLPDISIEIYLIISGAYLKYLGDDGLLAFDILIFTPDP